MWYIFYFACYLYLLLCLQNVCTNCRSVLQTFCRYSADNLIQMFHQIWSRLRTDLLVFYAFCRGKTNLKRLKPIQKIWKQLFFVTKYLKLIGPFFTSQPKQLNLIPRSSHLQLCCTFDIIGWLIAKFFQTWLTVAGYSELCVCFLPIGNGETFWMNNNVTYCALDKLVYLSDNFSIGPKPHNVSINSTKTFTELY